MSLSLSVVDAFTDQPFAGNPAAVCLMDGPREDAWMQALAREMNLSETAFLQPRADGFDLRWFTPAVEVDLCGHATLASAHALWGQWVLPPDEPARFHTRSGLLTATRDGDWIQLVFPAKPLEPADPPADLLGALGLTAASFVGRNQFDYLVEVPTEAELRAVAPDFGRLARVRCRGVIVTAPAAAAEFDFVSRFFAPASG